MPINRRIILDVLYHDMKRDIDKLKIRSVVRGREMFVADLTGKREYHQRFASFKNRLLLMFTSDGGVTKRGFFASYHSKELGR